MSITLAQAQETLAAYVAAELAVLKGQEYTISGRTLRRADLKSIQDGIAAWEARVSDLQAQAAGRGRRWGVSRAGF